MIRLGSRLMHHPVRMIGRVSSPVGDDARAVVWLVCSSLLSGGVRPVARFFPLAVTTLGFAVAFTIHLLD